MNSDRKIGRIIFVDSFKAVIELDSELKSLTKSDYNDIYEVARINSYVIIPVLQYKIIGLITKVQLSAESTALPQKTYITLPETERKITVTMIGTILPKSEGKFEFKQGVSIFPTLDNPVWFITDDELDLIFDSKIESIDYKKDYFIPIGESPTFRNYAVKINPDKFFGKHAAILGNTGSGKSCTITALLQSIFNYNGKNDDFVKNAHFVILDSNGEYRNAFIKNEEGDEYTHKDLVNVLYISSDLETGGLRIPYWFMNFEDFSTLFKASEKTQMPVLNRALSIARKSSHAERILEGTVKTVEELIIAVDYYLDLINYTLYPSNVKSEPYISNEIYEITVSLLRVIEKFKGELDSFEMEIDIFEENEVKDNIENIRNFTSNKKYHKINPENKEKIREIIDKFKEKISYLNIFRKIKLGNVDAPSHFNFESLLNKYLDLAMYYEGRESQNLREFVSTMVLRMYRYFNDERFKFIFNPEYQIHKNALALFLRYVLGQLNIYETNDDIKNAPFGKYYEGLDINKEKPNQVTIIDLSLLSSEVLENVTALIARLILEFSQRIEKIHGREKRGEFPVVLVLEEAHNYIPERRKETDEEISVSKKVFERIAREGRKYGMGLVISSQRPSEVSKTVLAQCNSFIVHRLQNPEDQHYIRQLVPSINQDLLDQLPVLPQQHAIIMGDCIRAPVQVKINEADPTPASYDPEFFKHWMEKQSEDFPSFEEICKNWEGKVDNEEDKQDEVSKNDENDNNDEIPF